MLCYVPNMNAIEQSMRSYCDFSVWPCDLEHCVTCCARLWDNFR